MSSLEINEALNVANKTLFDKYEHGAVDEETFLGALSVHQEMALDEARIEGQLETLLVVSQNRDHIDKWLEDTIVELIDKGSKDQKNILSKLEEPIVIYGSTISAAINNEQNK